MSKVDALGKYSNEVQSFRFGGILFYQTILSGFTLTIFNAVIPRGPISRSNLLILLCSLMLLITQLVPVATITVSQVMVLIAHFICFQNASCPGVPY